ncbi:hypothetical protein DOE76_14385 [Leifsonia sp. ku-ls]|nr:hypothetical protein DOE76_14385 [Leifsonia sp. ku-ls]
MPVPFPVVLVVGRPAAGKTTIGAEIARRWRLPVVSKDDLKEVLFDTLGTGDRQWSETLGRAAFALLHRVIELQLQAGSPFLVDAAFTPRIDNGLFQEWQARYGFTAVQVRCRASADELLRRFESRARDGSRHPGHADAQRREQFRLSLQDGRDDLLDLRGHVLDYDSEVPGAAATVLRALGPILS